jgi:hypothetical protein
VEQTLPTISVHKIEAILLDLNVNTYRGLQKKTVWTDAPRQADFAFEYLGGMNAPTDQRWLWSDTAPHESAGRHRSGH